MKKPVYFALAVILFTYSACKQSYLGVTPKQSIYMNAQRNGIGWTATPYASFGTNDTIIIAGRGTGADTLGFKIKYTSPGTYVLDSTEVAYHIVPLNDTTSNSYKLDSTFNNTINITYSQDLSLATGNFSVKFIDPKSAAGISFLNGNFSVALSK